MRIAIDCRTILHPGHGEGAGIGHYVYFLVKHLLSVDRRNRYILFFDRRLGEEAAWSFIDGAPNAEAAFFPFGQYRKFLPVAYSHLIVAGAIAERRPDVFHLPAGTVPLALRVPTVVTVHDLAIYAHPSWFPKQDFSVKVAYPRTVRSARRLIAVSDATRRDVIARFRVPPGRITRIHPGVDVRGSGLFAEDVLTEEDAVDWADLVRRYALAKPYILYLGTIEPRKNVAGLAEAFARAWKESPALQGTELLVAGAPGWSDGGALAAIRSAARATKGAVRTIGYVAHRDKFPLMRSARAFAFPSFAEGFGMPVAEALALGVPTVVSDIGVFREVAGEAALYADPRSPAAMAKALLRAVADARTHRRLALAGPKRAKRFSWEKAARETIAVYRKAAGR